MANSNRINFSEVIASGVVSGISSVGIVGGVVVVDTPVFSATQTWNSGADQFQGIRLSITDTASLATSLLANFLVGGATKFSVGKFGDIVSSAGTITASAPGLSITQEWNNAGVNFIPFSIDITPTAFDTGSRYFQIVVAATDVLYVTGEGVTTAVTISTGDLNMTNDNGAKFTNQTSGPGASVGTLTDAPSAGNPDFWLPVQINGTAHWIPAWAA